MYELIKKQIAADYFQQRFPNDGQRFVAWYLRNILFRDMNETRDDITDGGDDKQIDAIVIDDDKALVRIIQGKFIQSGTVDAEPLREVLSAWMQIKDLARLQNVANPKLQRKLAELATALDDDYDVSFELITTGALTEAALHDLEAFQQELAKLSEKENFDATIHVIDGDELRRRFDYAIESDNPSINYTLNLAGSKYMFHEIAGTLVLIAAVPLKECIRLPGIKIPWGVDSDQFWGQTEVANPLNLEAANVTRAPSPRTERYSNQSRRTFRLIGAQSFDLADHLAVAGPQREDVEAQRIRRRHRCAAGALFGAQAEGVRADGKILPDHRHSGGGTGWLLDSPCAAERTNRKPRCRCGLDCDLTPAAAGQDRQDRRRGFGARTTGVQTRRTACLRHGQGADV